MISFFPTNSTILKRCGLFLLIGFALLAKLMAQVPGEFYYSGEETVALKGKWKFIPNEFATLTQILDDTAKIYVDVPGDWHHVSWNDQVMGRKGFGTYYAKIQLEPDSDLTGLALKLPEVGIAYSVYLDDQFIGSLGVPSTDPANEKPRIDPQIIELPDLKGEVAYLRIHISNHQYTYGGMYYPPLLGKEQSIRIEKERYNTIKLLILGTVIILGLYMLYVYIRLRREKFRLYFALICLVLLTHTLTTGDMPLLDIFPSLPWVILKKTAFISFFLIAASNGLFLMHLFPKYFKEQIVYGVSIASLITVIFTLIAPVGIGALLVSPFQLFTIITGLYFFERLTRATYDNIEGSRLLLIGYTLAFFAGINDILTASYILSTPQMAHFGMFAYILFLTMIMAMRYVNALKKNENEAESLLLSNEYLEKNIQDRTRKLEVKNQLIDAKNRELQKALKEQEDLMAVVAHDLKAPFNQIQELTELLKDKAKLKKEHASYVEMILKVTANARRVIENLVFLRSYQDSAKQLEFKAFDPAAFFEGKVAAFQSEAAKKGISIEHGQSIKAGLMTSDESALDRIIDNLLSNAIKFSPLNGKVAFEMLEEKNDMVFRVKDYGEGFSPEDKKKAFTKFQKLSTKPTAGELSTGLGLSIVKALVERLGGTVKLFSEKGKGAEFIVRLPKVTKENAVSV